MNKRDRELIARLQAAFPDATIEHTGRGQNAKLRIQWPDMYTLVGARSLRHIVEWGDGIYAWEGHEHQRRPWNDADLAVYIDLVRTGLAAHRAERGEP